MKELLIRAGPKATVIESPVPRPGPKQVIVKVVVAGANPKDWKYPERFGADSSQGEDMAGIVHEVGEDVSEFKAGDHVAALHEFGAPRGAFSEYAMAESHTTFHIPKKTSSEDAATIPLNGPLLSPSLPPPWSPISRKLPLIIYGASSAVGCYAIKLALRANIHPLILIAGHNSAYAKTVIDSAKGDTIIDYNEGPEKVIQSIREILQQNGLRDDDMLHAFDIISERGSWRPVVEALNPEGEITTRRPIDPSEFPDTMKRSRTGVAGVHSQLDTRGWDPDFGYVFFRLFGRGLADGRLTAHPWELREGGLNAVEGALRDLKEGRNNAKKYIFRIAEG